MGDFHHDDFGNDAMIGQAVEAINSEAVDLVVLVGEFHMRKAAVRGSVAKGPPRRSGHRNAMPDEGRW